MLFENLYAKIFLKFYHISSDNAKNIGQSTSDFLKWRGIDIGGRRDEVLRKGRNLGSGEGTWGQVWLIDICL